MHWDCGHLPSAGRQSIFLAASLKMPLSYQGCLASKQASGHRASKGVYFPRNNGQAEGEKVTGLCRHPDDLPHSQLIGFAHLFTHFSKIHTPQVDICTHNNSSPHTQVMVRRKSEEIFFDSFLSSRVPVDSFDLSAVVAEVLPGPHL